ncbi:hypothetical protein [Gynuella sp.]|uniref:hypothetical protein n=1 Tax=Gynuella sp. TaxID=2969146 RepID=UPI003D0E934D
MNSEIEIHGSFFGVDLENLNNRIKDFFPKDSYEYRHLEEINVEDSVFEFWFREDDTAENGMTSVLLSGTYSGSSEDVMIIINQIIDSLDSEENANYQFDLIEQDQDGNEIGDMISLSNL